MSDAFEHVCYARLPAMSLAALADLRREPGIRVTPAGDHAWVRWEAGNEAVLRRLLPIPGVELYGRRDGHWYRPGAHLPSFDVPGEPEGRAFPLARAVTPGPIQATRPDVGASPAVPVRLGLEREVAPREATAIRCGLADLARWAEMAPTAQLAGLLSAWAADVVMILGRRLPTVAGDRFWGDRLLSPLGFLPEPGLPEAALRRALGVAEEEIVVLELDGFETIPRGAFRPLTRAGIRLALGGPPP
jgi:hypothetical protein